MLQPCTATSDAQQQLAVIKEGERKPTRGPAPASPPAPAALSLAGCPCRSTADAPESKNSHFFGCVRAKNTTDQHGKGIFDSGFHARRRYQARCSTGYGSTESVLQRQKYQNPRALINTECIKPSWFLRGTPLPPGAPSGVIATLPNGGSTWHISEHKNHIFPPHMSPTISLPHSKHPQSVLPNPISKQHRDVYPDPISAAPASSRASPLGCSGCTSPPSKGLSVPTSVPITRYWASQRGHGLQVSREAHVGQIQPAPCTLTAPHTLMLCPQTPGDPPVAMQDPGNNSS